MVQKWQKVKKEVEEEERNREEKEAEIRRKLQELQEDLGWRGRHLITISSLKALILENLIS